MGFEDRDWYRDEVKKNPKKYGLPDKSNQPGTPQFRRYWEKHLNYKPSSKLWSWVFWIVLLFVSFFAFKHFENKTKTQPSVHFYKNSSSKV